jgi:hypothetical protein
MLENVSVFVVVVLNKSDRDELHFNIAEQKDSRMNELETCA